MMYEYFKDLASGIEAKILQDPNLPNPRKKYALEIARLGTRLYSGKDKAAWCGIAVPFDLLNAMGITSCFVEFVGAVLASTGMADDFLEEAEQAGFVGDTCGFHRSVIGAARKEIMPEPDFLIASTCPCSGGVAVLENLAHMFKKDLFVLNVPQEQSEQSVKYLADQIKDMVDFISRHTGEPLDENKLRQAVAKTNKAREIMQDMYRLAQKVPSLISASSYYYSWAPTPPLTSPRLTKTNSAPGSIMESRGCPVKSCGCCGSKTGFSLKIPWSICLKMNIRPTSFAMN